MVVATPEQVRDEAVDLFEQSFGWIELLSPEHLHAFMIEYADAIGSAIASGDKDVLNVLIEDWEATAELDAAPEVLAAIRQSKNRRPLSDYSKPA